MIFAGLVLILCVNQQATGQVFRGGIGQQLVQVGVGDAVVDNPLVLNIPNDTQRPPSRQVRSGRKWIPFA